jgi:DNA mismatch repair protein MutL
MPKIHLLAPDVISQIAAGEVIERPSFAVKELIENSLDANSKNIIIEIKDGGIKEIKITDDGEGIEKSDLEIALLPHTTSKITDIISLQTVSSLGFRGEALSSIAAISHVTLRSRTHDAPQGFMIESEYGKLSDTTLTGMPEGTQIIVQNLFHTLPARKKFLRSTSTEVRLITEIVSAYALSNPEVRFFLKHNDRIILDLPADARASRIPSIFGDKIHTNLFPLVFEDSYIKAVGSLGHPQIASKNAKYFLYINNRLVSDKMILAAVKDSYQTLIEKTSSPFFILHLTIIPEMLDVNIHPRKEHVAILNPINLYNLLTKEVKRALSEQNLTFHSLTWKKDLPLTKTTLGKALRNELETNEQDLLGQITTENVTQFHRLFILTQSATGIIIIDQHAAHERILFEKYSRLLSQKKSNKSFVLKNPVTLDLSLTQSQVLEEYEEIFKKLGYEIEHFHEHAYHIRKVPEFLKDFPHTDLISSYIEDLEERGDVVQITNHEQTMLAFLACKSAIKAGDNLTKEQMKDVLKQLGKSENNSTCPHGRPTRILITMEELYSMFKR